MRLVVLFGIASTFARASRLHCHPTKHPTRSIARRESLISMCQLPVVPFAFLLEVCLALWASLSLLVAWKTSAPSGTT